jgi:hypothetical protein
VGRPGRAGRAEPARPAQPLAPAVRHPPRRCCAASPRVVLGLAVTRPADYPDRPAHAYQAFRLADGAVIDIQDHPNRDDALASLTTDQPGETEQSRDGTR